MAVSKDFNMRMNRRMFSARCAIAGAIAVTLGIAGMPTQLAAQSAEDFYEGETLTILIGHPPGGSYDLYAQLVAAHYGKFIPGSPNVIVQHMPGGGGAKAGAYFFSQAPHDGSVVAILPETLAHIQLLEPERAHWDMAEARYIGRLSPVNSVFIARKGAPATTIEEMKTTEVNLACTGRSSRSAQMPEALNQFAGTKFNIICGYDGAAAATLAIMRGEADVVSRAWIGLAAEHAAEIESGEFILFLQAGTERLAELPDVPLMQEVTDEPTGKKVLTFVSAGAPIGRSLMVHQDIPEERLAVLRAAFEEMIRDPEFLADAKRRQAPIEPKSGDGVERDLAAILETPEDIVALTQEAIINRGN